MRAEKVRNVTILLASRFATTFGSPALVQSFPEKLLFFLEHCPNLSLGKFDSLEVSNGQ